MNEELTKYCYEVRELITMHRYKESESLIVELLSKYAHSAVPHNLYGILLEKENNHILAMKHFRAANALNPTYIPARYNLEQYGAWNNHFVKAAYCTNDCMKICEANNDNQFMVTYDENNIGHIVRK